MNIVQMNLENMILEIIIMISSIGIKNIVHLNLENLILENNSCCFRWRNSTSTSSEYINVCPDN